MICVDDICICVSDELDLGTRWGDRRQELVFIRIGM